MMPRENMLAAMRRQKPEYVPFGLSFTPPMQTLFQEKTGMDDPVEYWDFDVRWTHFRSPSIKADYSGYHPVDLPDGTYIDEWGIPNIPGSMYHFTKMVHPLEKANNLEDILNYPLPEYSREECWKGIKSDTLKFHERGYAVIGSLEITIFEVSWYLRGMERLMSDMFQSPELAEALLNRITGLRIYQAETFADFEVDILALGDDIAMQTGMLMSPQMWRQWFKPRLYSVIKAAKEKNPEILIWYHTDGDCRSVIPELIEIGVDILNPLQPECMNPVEIKKEFGDQLSFSGTIGTQSTMPHGTPEDVRAAVKEMIETVGKDGGLFLAPTHVIEPDVPWENVIAFVEAVKEFGK